MADDAPALRPDWYLRGRLRLRHLRLLVVLDDVNHVGEAARQMATTQPAISKMLAEIEKLVGASLFTRTSKGTFPTARGASMIRHARWVLGDLDRMGAEWSSGHLPHSETIRAGVNSSTAAFLMPHALIALPQWSNARVLIREGSIEALLPDVQNRKLDLLIARLGPDTVDPDLVQDVLGDEPMCVVASANHPLAGRTSCTWQEVTTFPWVLPPSRQPRTSRPRPVIPAAWRRACGLGRVSLRP
ncbi:LysR family transcriptional regulator [Pigmentiphaga kullae]|uniref:LysR family transcriptional regulator n=1 Tax=Pigmentiphaga kullae TaxID=151784 RepID=UPI00241543BA|nr:LysR family transcriptional regulator [Pigmentiphaga kullae]